MGFLGQWQLGNEKCAHATNAEEADSSEFCTFLPVPKDKLFPEEVTKVAANTEDSFFPPFSNSPVYYDVGGKPLYVAH